MKCKKSEVFDDVCFSGFSNKSCLVDIFSDAAVRVTRRLAFIWRTAAQNQRRWQHLESNRGIAPKNG